MPSAVADVSDEEPVVKRVRLTDGHDADQPVRSRIFAPFRTVGLVSPTCVPFTAIPLGTTTFQINTSVGKCVQTYDLRRGLNLVFLTRPETPEPITATFAWKDKVLAAWGTDEPGGGCGVWVFKRGKKVGELEIPAGSEEPIKQLLCFGSWIVGCCSTRIEVWKSGTYEHYTAIAMQRPQSDGATNLSLGPSCHMPTFLNKLFVGRADGRVEIWNLSTGKLVYTVFPRIESSGPVTALQPTPALSCLAIAYGNGKTVIHDIRLDKEILRLDTGGPPGTSITSITFRTDGLGAGEDGRKAGVMATACTNGVDITFWDLNKGGRVMGILRGAHSPPSDAYSGVAGGVSKVEFLPGQAVLVSSGLDNALKSWIFDEAPYSPTPRILHARGGHAAPVTKLQFVPSDTEGADAAGKWLLSASKDRSLWGWSLRRDGQSTELSQGNIPSKARKIGALGAVAGGHIHHDGLEHFKAPEITCLALSLNRDGGIAAAPGAGSVWSNAKNARKATDSSTDSLTGWESVLTGHKGDKFARTWFWGRKRAGRWTFETGDGGEVKSVEITQCGTFALIGSSNGGIDMFNLQSGLHRQRFPSRLTSVQAKKLQIRLVAESIAPTEKDARRRKFAPGEGKHTKAVTGIMVDSVNRTMISCGLDGKLKFWDFGPGILRDEIDWYPSAAIVSSQYFRPSDLVALGCDDLSIRVVDIETKKVVRELWGCAGQISDFCFSNDGRWIIAASMDSIIRVWDLPTGHLIDAFSLESTCTALAFSSTGEFLATAHTDTVGINIWNNRSLFTNVATRNLSEAEIRRVSAPTASGEGGQGLIEAAFETPESTEEEADGIVTSAEQLSEDMLSLSLVPKARWQTLLHLDLIRQRNKPVEPPKAPEKAPFFLPSLQNKTQSTQPDSEPTQVTAAEISRVRRIDHNGTENLFTKLLISGHNSTDYEPFISHLKTLSPAAADIEIRSLKALQTENELVLFVLALTSRLRQRRDYELIQAWMTVFLRVHGDVVSQNDELIEALKEWRVEQTKEANRLNELVRYCAGVVGFLRSGRV